MRNIIELLNGFYDLDIPNQIDPASSFLFISLLKKFNNTKNKSNGEFFPESLPIYNSELSHLTGMESRSLRNARERLVNFRLIESDDTTWILKYEPRGTKESGIYIINYILLELFDYGKFGNRFFHNEDDYGKFGNVKCKDVPEFEYKSENLVTKNADLYSKSDPKSAKDVPLSNTILNETKQNKTSYMGPSIISTTKNSENEKTDDDVIAIAKEIAEKRLEVTTQVKTIQKRIREKYGLKDWDKPPSDQFLLDLMKLHKDNGGYEYILEKLEQLPYPLEISKIGDKLRSYCSHPEINGNNKQPKVKDKIDLEIEAINKELEICSDKDRFWELKRKALFLSKTMTPEDVFATFSKIQQILDPKASLGWFIQFCESEKPKEETNDGKTATI